MPLTQSSPERPEMLCNFLLSEYKKIVRKLCVMVWFFLVGFTKYMRSVCYRGTPHPGGVPRAQPRLETEPSRNRRSSCQYIFIHGSLLSSARKDWNENSYLFNTVILQNSLFLTGLFNAPHTPWTVFKFPAKSAMVYTIMHFQWWGIEWYNWFWLNLRDNENIRNCP